MPSPESTGSVTERPYTSSLNGFGMNYNRTQTTVVRALADLNVDSSELPLKPVPSQRSPESTWSTEVNADEDAEYQKDASNVAASDTETSEKAPVTDKQVADETSGAGGWADAAQES